MFVIDAKDQIQNAKTRTEECKLKVKHIQAELKDLTPKAKLAEKEQKHLVDGFKSATSKVETLQVCIKKQSKELEERW